LDGEVKTKINKQILTPVLVGIIVAVVFFAGVASYNVLSVIFKYNAFDLTNDKVAVFLLFDDFIMVALFGVLIPELRSKD
jgi:hypothetical protein